MPSLQSSAANIKHFMLVSHRGVRFLAHQKATASICLDCKNNTHTEALFAADWHKLEFSTVRKMQILLTEAALDLA
jgi:hypothetical protein